MLFDTHAHYDDAAFDPDRELLLESLPQRGVALVLNPGCDLDSSRKAVSYAAAYPHVYAAVGIHPENCAGFVRRISTCCVNWPDSPRWRPSARSVWTTTGPRTRPGSSSSRCCAPSWSWPVRCAYRSFSTTARPTGTRWPSFGSSPMLPACSTASPAARRWRGSCWTWAGTWASTAL